MPDAETAVLLRTVLDELLAHEPSLDASAMAHVVTRLDEAVRQGRCGLDDLRQVGNDALHQTPTMWR